MASLEALPMVISCFLLTTVYGQFSQERLDRQETALNRLAARLSDLSDQLDSRLDAQKTAAEDVEKITWLLDDKYGDGCPERTSRCGDSTECVSDLAVCDGIQDCKNGYDESDRACDFPLPVNTVFKGFKMYNYCMLTERTTSNDYWMITAAERVPYFPSVQKINWTYFPRVVNKYATMDGELEGVGHYFHGSRQMHGYFQTGNRLIGRVQSMGSENFFIVRGYRAAYFQEGQPCFIHYYTRTTPDEL